MTERLPEPSDYQVQRHPVYRAMKDRLRAEIEELREENARLCTGVMSDWKPADVRALPLFQELRERHHELKAKNEELRRELGQVLPTPYAIRRSEEYRTLRAKHKELLEEVREARRELKRAHWAESGREAHRDTARWALETLTQILPDRRFDPDAMAGWHLEQATLWADIAGMSLSRLAWRLRHMREEDLDPHRNHREKHGYVPAALRAKLLHEDAECNDCGRTDDLSIDHVIPLVHGGTSAEENLQVLCRSCNSKKGARLERATSNGEVGAT